MTFSDQLIQKTEKVVSGYTMPDLTEKFPLLMNLVFLYHAMKASANLLRVAGEQETNLKGYFQKHLLEEQDHDKWLAEDLLTAGVDVTETVTPRVAVEMVGSIYYLIYHIDPVAQLGYMAVMECLPKSEKYVEYLESLHGKDLLRTVRYHTEHDIAHGKDLREVLDSCTPDQQFLISQVAEQSAHYFGRAMQAIANTNIPVINTPANKGLH